MPFTEGRERVSFSQVAIVGAACRLPGAPDEKAFWSLLSEGHCAVGDLPEGRWQAEKFLHPRLSEPGSAYSFSGGYVANPLSFDPSVFGISPREAAEMDPQQRLLLEVVWEALENAGIAPSDVAGRNVGVYVGASSLDYGTLHTGDAASIDSHFMTGNTLSILSNRISYIFDLRGPSFTVDTACSSSLVAFAQAQAAISSGRIDVAIVAGVSLLLSPTSFIGFSRASMLSPTGLCRPFSANADGYVRAEGAVATVLANIDHARASNWRVRAVAVASGINSDGRTNGISLPSVDGQRELLEQLYGDGGIDPNRLAFVEAHGTGTKVGDPAEARAIGEALGQSRSHKLPIGSVKSNIGHLEPASGLAGLFKAVLALEHRLLPRSLHLDHVNAAIDFDQLNLALARDHVVLPADGEWLAGVSSFGFGGTNAHVILSQPIEPASHLVGKYAQQSDVDAQFLALSAHSRQALPEVARRFAACLKAGVSPRTLAAANAWQRDMANYRLALPLVDDVDIAGALEEFASTGKLAQGAVGTAPAVKPEIAFVYSGNGSQWAGMGYAAFENDVIFRDHFKKIDQRFGSLSGWSLVEALLDPALAERLAQTRIAQPLLYAIQSSLTCALRAWGLQPGVVFGHSVGEVAAAEAAGLLSLDQAIHVIFQRSEHQEDARGRGGMAVTNMSAEAAREMFVQTGCDDLEIAAINSPSSVTLSGPLDTIAKFTLAARKKRVAVRKLDLDYPFHSAILEPLHGPLLASLGDIVRGEGELGFISTVTGTMIGSSDEMGAEYWWRNVREPVRFLDAVEQAARSGTTLFVEIGPRPILSNNIADTLRDGGYGALVMPSLEDKSDTSDPIRRIIAQAIVLGCPLPREKLFGSRPGQYVPLPSYPWQHKDYAPPITTERLDLFGAAPRHPLIGARLATGSPEWRNLIDAMVVPYLADHRIDDEIIVPGAAFAEMALAAGREIFPEGAIGLVDFDLLQWMVLRPDTMREVCVRLDGDMRGVEILSRPRLAADEWTLHARGRIEPVISAPPAAISVGPLQKSLNAEQVYAAAHAVGVNYGPAFQRVVEANRAGNVIDVRLSSFDEEAGSAKLAQILHPVALDASFHPLFDGMRQRGDERYAFLPVRFAELRVYRDHAHPARARVVIERETDESISISVALYDKDEICVATLNGGLFRAVVLDRRPSSNAFFHQEQIRIAVDANYEASRACVKSVLSDNADQVRPEIWLLLEAFSRSLVFATLHEIVGTNPITPSNMALDRAIAPSSVPLVLNLAAHLCAAGLADDRGDGIRLAQTCDLPDAADILRLIAADHPGATAEIVIAAQVLAGLADHVREAAAIALRPVVHEQFDGSAALLAPLISLLVSISEALGERLHEEPLRIIIAEPGSLAVLRALAPLVQAGQATICVAGTDHRRLHHLQARFGLQAGVSFLEIGAEPEAPADIRYDVAFALARGPAFIADPSLARAVARRLAPEGLICVAQVPDSIIFDLMFGATDGWFDGSSDWSAPQGQCAQAGSSAAALANAGFVEIETIALADGMGNLSIAHPASTRRTDERDNLPVAILGCHEPFFNDLAAFLRAAGSSVQHDMKAALAVPADIVISTAGNTLDQAIMEIAELLKDLENSKTRLWVIIPQSRGQSADPGAEAIRCFLRVARNEYPSIDIRAVIIGDGVSGEQGVARLGQLILACGSETELMIDGYGVSAVRMRAVGTSGPGSGKAPSVRLSLRNRGMLSSLEWSEAQRRAPVGNEVEIRVVAAGLNFRDVMLATGLLDDDVLDDGLAGAVFGFECAGRVVRSGEDAILQPGDAVMGFARESFATYCTADERVFTRLPDELPPDAAATIPVAFLTAWYGLVHQARIQRGEWVLIHGAAGGVGLAAIQIARLMGARVAATVSSPDKRALVELFGAEKIFNSRSTIFLDAIRADIGGVDVVVNSLAGDAMLASVKCLKPFGRFIELGKRDYVLNTSMGLRPFRRNLTYFGVDIDQLLAANLGLAQQLMGDIVRHFDEGDLTPLPYRAFDWHEAASAFQIMQSAGHVGKLTLRPASEPVTASSVAGVFEAGEGVHLVIGGCGGFGFETASWLAASGARTIVVASRRGRIEDALLARAEAIRAGGVTLVEVALDVTDAMAVEGLVSQLAGQFGRIAGVIHAAVMLDDGVIAGMTSARTRAVLAPKVDGAENLDRATRGYQLDYFVLYSSATTMVGNLGQGAYVAANGYLQGLIDRRREQNLPGLAIGWGAIADAGILARDQAVAAMLERMSGIASMKASDALACLGVLLAAPREDLPSTIYCAVFRSTASLKGLALMQTPAFAELFSAEVGLDQEESVDLAAQVAGMSEGDARRFIAGIVASEVARILRLSADEIDVTRPLDELGMDSLMSLDLRMGIEKRCGVELPVVAIGRGVSLNDLATRLQAELNTSGSAVAANADAQINTLRQHGVSESALSELRAITETLTPHDTIGQV